LEWRVGMTKSDGGSRMDAESCGSLGGSTW